MSRRRLLIALGLLVGLAPFLGLPYSYLFFILPVLGLAVILTAVLLGPRRTIVEPPVHEGNVL